MCRGVLEYSPAKQLDLQAFRSVFRTRRTVVNLARKSSSSRSRVSGGIRCTNSSRAGKGLIASSSSSGATADTGTGVLNPDASLDSAKNAASAASSGQTFVLSSPAESVDGTTEIGSDTCFAGSTATANSGTLIGTATRSRSIGAAVSVGRCSADASRISNRSISPFFFRRCCSRGLRLRWPTPRAL